MSKRTTKVALRGTFAILMAVGLQTILASSSMANGFGIFQESDGEPRLATHETAGEIHFALSIAPKASQTAQRASDIVIYVDTSASQTGVFKRDSIDTVKHMLKNLNAEDRVQIVAVDLDPVSLTNGFVNPASTEAKGAIASLNDRVSLGSTDLEAMLKAAAKAFPADNARNKNVVYVGDAISRQEILHTEVFTELVNGLADNQVSFSSFAIGPERNIELMAALANNTGGNYVVDSDADDSVRQGAIILAQTVHGSVLWPITGELDESIVEIFPHRFPPLRSDRDTIVLGTLADRDAVNLTIGGVFDGADTEMNWTITPEANSVDFNFLSSVIKDARKDNGYSLPTAGSEGLREYVRSRSAKAYELTKLGGQALAMGNKKAAYKLAGAALATDPSNTNADLLAMASTYKVQDDDPFGGSATADDPFGSTPAADTPAADDPFGAPQADTPAATDQDDPFGGEAMKAEPQGEDVFGTPTEDTPATVLPVEPGQEQPGAITVPTEPAIEVPAPDAGAITLIAPDFGDDVDGFLRDSSQMASGMILSEEERIKIINQRTRQQVQIELSNARKEIKSNPDSAIERLKNVIEIVDQTVDLYPSTRAELRHSLESSLLSSRQKKLDFDEAMARQNLNVATSRMISATADGIARDEEQISRLINRFNSLVDEGNYEAAIAVTNAAREVSEDEPAVMVAREKARVVHNYNRLVELREMKQVAFAATMYEIEKASVPFPGNPLMIFPDADEWKAKKLRRKKYQNLRLSGSENDEKILKALEEPADFAYDETPWNEIEEELEDKYKINIVLTVSARDDSLAEDDPVTATFTGIRLKNALRQMLAEKNATFVVKDEVLMIISKDDVYAEEYSASPNVYNVGDLVAPRFNPGGGIGGGQGGGGQGGLGGGQGGGGQGGGGGGGVFCVQESQNVSLRLGAGTSQTSAPAKSSRPTVIVPKTSWAEHFESNFADPADVRLTARKLMKANQPGEVVEMINAAIQNEQLQPWMYEGLVLAMQVSGAPKADLERALMSTVDLSNDENDMLYAANFMLDNKMEKRAIRLLKSFARANPVRTEPYVLGLRAAQKINDIDGIKWATTGIFSQEWPEHPEVVKQAKYASLATKKLLRKEGRLDELASYEKDLNAAMERDCFIDVSWTGDADIDLFVVEPGGTVCSRLTKRTSSGGVSMGDRFSPKAGLSGKISEQYILPRGFAGDYRLMIKRIWGEVTSGKVTVSIHNHYRSDFEASMTKQVELDDKGAMVLFSLDRGRRTEALEDHQIRTAVKNQLATNQIILAQQLDDSSSSSAESSYYGSLVGAGSGGNGLAANNNVAGNNRFGLTPSQPGYQPVITQIPEGAFFTVNHATTSDRMYVMVSVSPFFSQISSVSTFNIFGDADTATGIANSAGGQGGGAGGGGAGGGGAGGGGTF